MKRIAGLFILMVLSCGCSVAQKWTTPDMLSYREAEIAYLKGDFAGAAERFRTLGSIPGSEAHGISLYWEGMSRLQTGEFHAAHDAFDASLACDPPEKFLGPALLGFGRACLGIREYDEAAAALLRALEECPGFVPPDFTLLHLGLARLRGGDWDEAMETFETVLSANPGGAPAKRASACLAFKNAGGFTIQVGAFVMKRLAEKEAARLRKKGLDARIIKITSGIKLLHAVCVGCFSDYRKADLESKRLRGHGLVSDAVVRP